MEKYDVVIIGAGLAGLQTARLLGQSGARVLLADRKHEVGERVHTTGIFVRRTLEDFALPPDCLGVPVRHVTLYSPRGRTLELESPHDEFRVGRMNRLYTRLLEQCLDDQVTWAHGARYLAYDANKENSKIHFETNGKRWSAQARYIVGADGAQSRVGNDLGLDKNSEWIVGVEEVFSARSTQDQPDNQPRFHCFLDPILAPGYLAWVVNDGEEAHVGVGGYAAYFDPLQALEKFKGRVADNIFDCSKAVRLERRGGRIPVGGVLKNIANERGLLVGDAAGAVSPLTAGGLDPCMRLSQLAARIIADYLATGDRQVLSEYSGEQFRARFVSRLWMRRLIADVRQPFLLEIVCAMLRLPVFKSLAWHVFFGRGSFPDIKTLTVKRSPKITEIASS
ncbi:MAG: NAD(P)/FAD-dependent oxidoreductase [Pyrinomonadaceae bacterium]